jgi:hypothetical protein
MRAFSGVDGWRRGQGIDDLVHDLAGEPGTGELAGHHQLLERERTASAPSARFMLVLLAAPPRFRYGSVSLL